MHNCALNEGQFGMCKARMKKDGRIIPVNYGRITSIALDPIEKKPLARFHPGSFILSVGSFGCNMTCPFCQNHDISRADISFPSGHTTPEELSSIALELSHSRGNIGIAYTYNEPLTGYEFVRDTAKRISEAGLYNVLVSNGEASSEVCDEILPYMDAMNIDLKAFSHEAYRSLGGDLDMVRAWIERVYRHTHLEITSLIVPGINDDPADMDRQAAWIASLDSDITLHITRFFPRYHMTDSAPTDIRLMQRLKAVAEAHLSHVYLGNV